MCSDAHSITLRYDTGRGQVYLRYDTDRGQVYLRYGTDRGHFFYGMAHLYLRMLI